MSDEGWRTDTAERPAVRVPPTPPADQADQADRADLADPAGQTESRARREGSASPDRPDRRSTREPAPAWIAWLVVAAVLVATAFVGAYLVVRDPGATTATDPVSARADTDDPTDDPSPEAATSEKPSKKPSRKPSEQPSEAPSAAPADPVDVTASATVTVPRAAPSNNDVTGELVSFAGANMLDGDVTTTWRMAGDGTGSTITFTFADPVTLTRVGLVNGYTKVSVDDTGQAWDWYHGNRRLVSAEWVVGGQIFPQTYADTAEPQELDIAPVETTTVELRLTGVTTPGPPPIGRDYTAISDVRFFGSL